MHVRSGRLGAAGAKRHVLIKGLVGCGAPEKELRRIVKGLRPLAGVVVLDLVIIPGDQRRHLGVKALQILIAAILGVAIAIGGERFGLGAIAVPTHGILGL